MCESLGDRPQVYFPEEGTPKESSESCTTQATHSGVAGSLPVSDFLSTVAPPLNLRHKRDKSNTTHTHTHTIYTRAQTHTQRQQQGSSQAPETESSVSPLFSLSPLRSTVTNRCSIHSQAHFKDLREPLFHSPTPPSPHPTLASCQPYVSPSPPLL